MELSELTFLSHATGKVTLWSVYLLYAVCVVLIARTKKTASITVVIILGDSYLENYYFIGAISVLASNLSL